MATTLLTHILLRHLVLSGLMADRIWVTGFDGCTALATGAGVCAALVDQIYPFRHLRRSDIVALPPCELRFDD